MPGFQEPFFYRSKLHTRKLSVVTVTRLLLRGKVFALTIGIK